MCLAMGSSDNCGNMVGRLRDFLWLLIYFYSLALSLTIIQIVRSETKLIFWDKTEKISVLYLIVIKQCKMKKMLYRHWNNSLAKKCNIW